AAGTRRLDLHVEPQHAVGQRRVARLLEALGAVDLDVLLRGQRLLGGLRQATHVFLDAAADATVAAADVPDHDADQRYYQQHGERHLEADIEHQPQHVGDG